MRNLKRVLSLALALVMVLGMMVITTSAADFTDAEEITKTEAVDVISAIGVITGDNGKFYPTRALTREEGAALICYLMMGKDKADKLVGSGNFADVKADRWSAGEIDYCANLGIILGYTDANGDLVFNPKGELTAVAFGRMLLGALGYDGSVEGYTGANWASSIAADMIDVGLEVNGVAMDAVLTREQAAQMAFQALTKEMVEYDDKGTNISIGGVEIVTGAKEAEVRSDVNKVWDETANDGAGAYVEVDYTGTPDGKLQFCEYYFDGLTKDRDTDNLYRSATKWTYDNKVVGLYASKAAATYVVTNATDTLEDIAEELELTLATSVDETATYPVGTVLELFKTGKNVSSVVYYSYEAIKVSDVEAIDDEDEMFTEYGATKTYTLQYLDRSAYDVYDDEDEGVEMIYVDTLSEPVEGYTAIGDWGKFDIITMYVGAKKATVAGETEVVTGLKTAEKTNAAKYVKIDGEKYPTADIYGDNYTTTYNWYLDPNGIVIDIDEYKDNSALNYVYVVQDDATVSTNDLITGGQDAAKVKVMYTDGTSEVVDYALTFTKDRATYSSGYYFKVGTTKYDLGSFESTIGQGWYSYTKNEAGEITLASPVKANASMLNDVNVAKDEKVVGTYVANDETETLYANTSTTVTVLNRFGVLATYTGYGKFPAGAGAIEAEDALVMYKGSTVSAVYIYDGSATADPDTVKNAIFVGTGETTADGVAADFYVAGEKVTYIVAAEDVAEADKGTLFEIEIDEEGVATAEAVEGVTTVVIDVISDDYLVDEDGNDFDLADTYSVWQMNALNTKATTGTLEEGDTVALITKMVNGQEKVAEIVIYKTNPYAGV